MTKKFEYNEDGWKKACRFLNKYNKESEYKIFTEGEKAQDMDGYSAVNTANYYWELKVDKLKKVRRD